MAMVNENKDRSTSGIVTAYLAVYNTLQALGWGYTLYLAALTAVHARQLNGVYAVTSLCLSTCCWFMLAFTMSPDGHGRAYLHNNSWSSSRALSRFVVAGNRSCSARYGCRLHSTRTHVSGLMGEVCTALALM
jgi:hypothetical protein